MQVPAWKPVQQDQGAETPVHRSLAMTPAGWIWIRSSDAGREVLWHIAHCTPFKPQAELAAVKCGWNGSPIASPASLCLVSGYPGLSRSA